jgi:predicted transcriptional regulator of viral defense system
MARSVSIIDAEILRTAARLGKSFIALGEDDDWLSQLTDNPRKQLSRMKSRGSLAHISHGRYLVLPAGASRPGQVGGLPVLLAAALPNRDDYYLGYFSALAEHRLTDEDSDAVYLAVYGKNLPRGLSELDGQRVEMNRITVERKWFGAERLRAQARSFYSRSDLERTLIDTLDRPDLCGEPEIWVRCWERAIRQDRVDVNQLMDYAARMSKSVAARAGFWLRELGRPREARLLFRAAGAPLKGRVVLDPSKSYGTGSWPRDRESGLYLNLPERGIVGWLGYGK